MDAKEIRTRLIGHTHKLCGHQELRQAVDMGRLGECPRKITWEMLHGCHITEDLKLRLYKARQMAVDIAGRLQAAFGPAYTGPELVTAFEGRLAGETKGRIGDVLIEVKSVPDDAGLPDGRAPNNHYWQTQSLMHFGKFPACVLIYESRSSGRIRTYDHLYSKEIGARCEAKARLILAAVEKRRLPPCECGKCAEKGYV